jgi:hypothetical protein
MKAKSNPQNNSSNNSVKTANKTVYGTRNYVSGEPAPSSANHKFQDKQGK